MVCKNCGTELAEGMIYCTSCGAAQSTENTAFYSDNAAQNMSTPNPAMPAGPKHNGKVNFVQAITLFFKNYANFNGRASKSEYWFACLFNMLISGVVSALNMYVPMFSVIGGAITLALLVPGISLVVRRLHDVGKKGTYYFVALIPIAGLIMMLIQLLKDSEGDNQWGPGPENNTYTPDFSNTTNGTFQG